MSRLAELAQTLETIEEGYNGPNPFLEWSPEEIRDYALAVGWSDVAALNAELVYRRRELGRRFLDGDDEAAYEFFFGAEHSDRGRRRGNPFLRPSATTKERTPLLEFA